MFDDPTVVHSFAAVGGASTLFTIFHIVRGAVRLINSKRADAAQERRSATAEVEDLKEVVERLRALVPVQPPPANPPHATMPWASVGSASATPVTNG